MTGGVAWDALDGLVPDQPAGWAEPIETHHLRKPASDGYRFAPPILRAACRDYLPRATGRPCFVKAHADQTAHFAAAD